MALTQDLQGVLDQIVAYFEAHPGQLMDGSYTTIGIVSRRDGNVRTGAQHVYPAFRGYKNLSDFTRQHGPFKGMEPNPPVVVAPTPKPAASAAPSAAANPQGDQR